MPPHVIQNLSISATMNTEMLEARSNPEICICISGPTISGTLSQTISVAKCKLFLKRACNLRDSQDEPSIKYYNASIVTNPIVFRFLEALISEMRIISVKSCIMLLFFDLVIIKDFRYNRIFLLFKIKFSISEPRKHNTINIFQLWYHLYIIYLFCYL